LTLPLLPPLDSTPLQALRDLLAGLDPACELLLDEATGDMLVRGSIDPAELDAALMASGLRMRVADRAGSECGCGCGCA
jgi:hypothetical protein